MMKLFCKHPAKYLAVEKEHTVERIDDDFDHINYHLLCLKCRSKVLITHAKMIGGVEGFLSRSKK